MDIRYLLLLVASFLYLQPVQAKNEKSYHLSSPDGKMEVTIRTGEQLSYSIRKNGITILAPSAIGLKATGQTMWGNQPQVVSHRQTKQPGYQETELKLKGGYGVIFRAYNEGVAYRFYTSLKGEIEIETERAEFNFEKDGTAWLAHTTNEKDPLAMAFQNTYAVTPLSEADTTLAFLPVTIATGEEQKVTLLESDLNSYPGLFLQAQKGSPSLAGVFAGLPKETDQYAWRAQEYVTRREEIIARVSGKRTYPWRILAISEKDTEMPLNRLVYELSPESRIKDTSWIQPGKCAWEWWNNWGITGVPFEPGINMETYKYYIDFASAYGLQYVILDEGWYDPKSGDMLTVVPELNLPELADYARNKGIRLILWTVFNVLDSQLEEACRRYAGMGIAGFKIDFLDRDDQYAVEMTHRIAEETAQHKLILNLHGYFKPTGIDRTWPHILNFEGVFGGEEAKWSTSEKDMPGYNVTFPFIRMMAGPVDFTPGAMRNATRQDFQPIYHNPMSQGTRCHQLAMYVVYNSPLTMLCDAPTCYEKEPEYTRFLTSIPVVTDETNVLDGKIGEYIVTARRKQSTWYIGGLTNWDSREITPDLSFLPDSILYDAVIYQDGVNAGQTATDYTVRTCQVNAATSITIPMAPGGGFVVRLTEAAEKGPRPTTVPAGLDIHLFYEKYLDADGIPIVSSANVHNEALMRAARVITQILCKRPDVKNEMIKKGAKVMIIGEKEDVCDLPEYAHICDTPENIAYWNKRARGFGGAPEHDFSASCGEENVSGLPGDRYLGESILIHEFAHILHMVGICAVDPTFNDQLETLRLKAIEKGLWKDTYAISNKEEYFAEAVQSFFNCNRFSLETNGVHNAINTRSKLKVYDPEIYALLLQYLPEIDPDIVETQKHE